MALINDSKTVYPSRVAEFSSISTADDDHLTHNTTEHSSAAAPADAFVDRDEEEYNEQKCNKDEVKEESTQDMLERVTPEDEEKDVDRRKVPESASTGRLPYIYHEEAETDLHEKQKWIEQDVQALREMVQREDTLRARTDTPFLLTFLRARKFDYDKAFSMVLGYYKAREENQSFYNNLTAASLEHVWAKKIQTVLPTPDRQGRTVLVFRAGAWNPSEISLDELFRAQVLLLEHVVRSPVTQLRGVAAVVDCSGLGRVHACNLTAAHIRRIVSVVQEVFPLRFKALHFVNEPAMFEWMFSVVRPFLSETIRGRLHFHGSNLESLYRHIPRDALPSEVGGTQPPLDNIELIQELHLHENYFLDHFSYGYTLPPNSCVSSSSSALKSDSVKVKADSCTTPTSPSSVFLDSVSDVGSFLGSYYRKMCID